MLLMKRISAYGAGSQSSVAYHNCKRNRIGSNQSYRPAHTATHHTLSPRGSSHNNEPDR